MLAQVEGIPQPSPVNTCRKGESTIGGGANILCMAIPTPSKTARRQAQPIAEFRIDRGPPRTANDPPVKKPAIIALELVTVHNYKGGEGIYFHGSSFCRILFTAQS